MSNCLLLFDVRYVDPLAELREEYRSMVMKKENAEHRAKPFTGGAPPQKSSRRANSRSCARRWRGLQRVIPRAVSGRHREIANAAGVSRRTFSATNPKRM
jgi:hypothetical protein